MVLPFEPMTMTFKDLHYWVQIPKESAKDRAHVHMEGGTPWLELLLGISGAFRPNVLTCLMGVTGAGKTTLMDVLAGRKTGERPLVSLLIGKLDLFLPLMLYQLATMLCSALGSWQGVIGEELAGRETRETFEATLSRPSQLGI